MVLEDRKDKAIISGIFAFIAMGLILILILPQSVEKTIILQTPSGTDSCVVDFVLAQNITDLCDATIISPTTNQIIQYNGSQWVNVDSAIFNDTVTCTNLGIGAIICPSYSGDNINIRTIASFDANLDVSVVNDTIFITNQAPENSVCTDGHEAVGYYDLCSTNSFVGGEITIRTLQQGTGMSLSYGTDAVTITNGDPESTDCTNLGTVGEGIVASSNGEDCTFKKLRAGTGISLSANGTRITFTNTLPEVTACNNVGTGNQLCSGGNVNIDTLIAGNGISITDTTDDWTIANTGIVKLCEAVATGGETTLTCTFSTSSTVKAFSIQSSFTSSSTDTWQLRFNGDGGNNYAQRSSTNGGADATSATTSSIASVSITGNQWYHYAFHCNQPLSTQEKHCYGDRQTSANGAGNADARVEFASKWANTASVITDTELVRTAGTGTMTAGSFIIVWGTA